MAGHAGMVQKRIHFPFGTFFLICESITQCPLHNDSVIDLGVVEDGLYSVKQGKSTDVALVEKGKQGV